MDRCSSIAKTASEPLRDYRPEIRVLLAFMADARRFPAGGGDTQARDRFFQTFVIYKGKCHG